ncbi:MAG: phosphoglucosamine mutase, partial [Clostridia bacterium]
LTDIEEVEIEAHIENAKSFCAEKRGAVTDGGEYVTLYTDALCKMIGRLDGLKVALDCANGASSRYAPSVFTQLGAEVVVCNVSPDGKK